MTSGADLDRLQALAIEQYNSGNLVAAQASYREVLVSGTADPTVLGMLGVIAARMGEHALAERFFMGALSLDPAFADQHLNLGLCRRDSGDGAAATASIRRAAALGSADSRSLIALATSALATGAAREAEAGLQKALLLAPAAADGWNGLGEARLAAGCAHSAATAFQRAAAVQPHLLEIAANLATAQLRSGRLGAAWSSYERILARRRASPWFHPELSEQAGPASGHGSFRETTRTKLAHDVEQLRYLLGLGLVPATYAETIQRYEAVLAEIYTALPVRLTANQAERLAPTYNRVLHRRMGAFTTPAVNPRLDDDAIAARFKAAKPGIVWVDELLTQAAVEELHRFCLESTIWFDYRHPEGYVGAMLGDGFTSPLLLQIAHELPERLPKLFGGEMLTQMWAFKYESGHAGTDLHADAARLNVNFWITPDEANLSPGRGGLEVWDRLAPADWDFAKFNSDQQAIRRFLAEAGARSVIIPYRRNRAAIFDSDLFHRTDDFSFEPGYANRRINVTILYGERARR
ncbi:MAG: tetratricopeptide repeat protein [Proteobacteria bacterium]|nr:tetratricopeptide repeat protein [Pseudomonadota bacterium]MBI3496970.1 tetratricopeptide repeat protein [Pseudomonadota bacterium]